jgi:hypothetical protein
MFGRRPGVQVWYFPFGLLHRASSQGSWCVDDVLNQGKASRAARRKAFEAEFAGWISAQNEWVEAHGIPGADLRPW